EKGTSVHPTFSSARTGPANGPSPGLVTGSTPGTGSIVGDRLLGDGPDGLVPQVLVEPLEQVAARRPGGRGGRGQQHEGENGGQPACPVSHGSLEGVPASDRGSNESHLTGRRLPPRSGASLPCRNRGRVAA